MMSDKEKSWRERAERVVNRVNDAFPEPRFQNWELCEELLLTAMAVYNQIEKFNIKTEIAALLLHKTAYYLNKISDYKEAEDLYKRSLTILEKIFDKDNVRIARSLNNLAELYRNQEKYTEAEPLYLRSLMIEKKLWVKIMKMLPPV
ncbi:MAG: tetratricopeptide repeat protein [Methylococcales bacterium]|nr:tetratricopeptide repeat protein [Methylococcales bacterium]